MEVTNSTVKSNRCDHYNLFARFARMRNRTQIVYSFEVLSKLNIILSLNVSMLLLPTCIQH